jgi:hypothetical protein
MNEADANCVFEYSFVDCDMFMWFLGIGIGHCSQHITEDNSQTMVGSDEDNNESYEDTEVADCEGEDEDISDDGKDTASDESDDDGYDNL